MKLINKPIEIALIQDKQGITTPLRFQVETKEEEKIAIQIQQILFMEKIKDPFVPRQHCIIYRCKSIIQDVTREYELKYDIESCKWYLYRM